MPIPRVSPLPVTGYANLNALGSSRTEILKALRAGRSGLGAPSLPLDFETCVGEVRRELPALPKQLAPWDTRIARMAAQLIEQLEQPLQAARGRWPADRIAVILGTSTGGARTTEQAYRQYVERGSLPHGYDFRRQHTFGAVLHVVSELSGATGPAWMISTACSSSAKPLASAQRLMTAGLIDAAIVGGIDTLCDLTLQGFHALQVVDKRPCRPFAANRAGLSLGEGGALALVERKGDARVTVLGVGESSDAYHISAPHPEGRGARDAMAAALQQAGCAPADIDHVNAHGTGTPLNDKAESSAIQDLLGCQVPVVSTKGFTGHTLGAAGAIEFAFAAYAVEEGWIPGSIHSDPLDPAIGLPISTACRTGPFRRVLSNSFAFGGNNVSVLVGSP